MTKVYILLQADIWLTPEDLLTMVNKHQSVYPEGKEL